MAPMNRPRPRLLHHLRFPLPWIALGLVLSLGLPGLAWPGSAASVLTLTGVALEQQAPAQSAPEQQAPGQRLTQAVPRDSIPAAPALAPSLDRQGQALYRSGQYADAAERWQGAAQGYGQQGQLQAQARALSNLALAHQALGQWQDAQRAIAQALLLLQQQPNPASQAQLLNTQGQFQLAVGDATAALASWQQAEQQYQSAGDRRGILRAQLNQIQALRALGFYRRALDQLAPLRPQLTALEDDAFKVNALTQAGELWRLAGDIQEAQTTLEQTLQLAQRLQLGPEQGILWLNLGALAQSRHQPDQALAAYDQAMQWADAATQPQVQLAQLSLHLQEGKLDLASPLPRQIQQRLAQLPISHSTNAQRIALATQLMTPGLTQPEPAWAEIETLLRQAQQQGQQLGDRTIESYALGTLAQAYYRQGRLPEARPLAEQALQLAQILQAPELAYRWHWTLSQILMAEGQTSAAIAQGAETITLLGQLQDDLVALNSDALVSFSRDIEPIYRGFIAMLTAPTTTTAATAPSSLQRLSPAYLGQVQAAVGQLRLAEMSQFLGENCLPLRNNQLQAIGQIDPTAAIIYPVILADRLEIFLSLPDQSFQHVSSPVGREQLERLVRQLRHQLVLRSRRRYLPLAQQLYDWMLRPLEVELQRQGIETLVFALDGVLQSIPVATLHDGEQFLIERYQVALSPSVELFTPRPLDQSQLQVIAAGLSQARQGYTPLPFVQAELDLIQQQVATTTRLLDEDFTRQKLGDRLREQTAPIVHIATHGQFGSRPEETFLLAWDQLVNVKQLDQMLQAQGTAPGTGPGQAPGRPSAIELLVLSACETAAGDDQALLGLAGLTVKAGARSTLATLWSVDDAGSAALMGAFYRAITQPGMGRAQALRQAQLALLRDPNYRHPLYWAAYVMVGNWL